MPSFQLFKATSKQRLGTRAGSSDRNDQTTGLVKSAALPIERRCKCECFLRQQQPHPHKAAWPRTSLVHLSLRYAHATNVG